MFRQLFFVLTIASLGLSGSSEAQSIQSPFERPDQLATVDRTELPPLNVRELFGGRATRALGPSRSGRSPVPSTLGVLMVRRELPALWEMRLDNELAVSDLDIQYSVTSLDGHPDKLRHLHDPNSEISVRVLEQQPVVLQSTSQHVVVQGGIALELQVEGVRSAGTHSGTVTVTVSQF